jgi:hypothetical protein
MKKEVWFILLILFYIALYYGIDIWQDLKDSGAKFVMDERGIVLVIPADKF